MGGSKVVLPSIADRRQARLMLDRAVEPGAPFEEILASGFSCFTCEWELSVALNSLRRKGLDRQIKDGAACTIGTPMPRFE